MRTLTSKLTGGQSRKVVSCHNQDVQNTEYRLIFMSIYEFNFVQFLEILKTYPKVRSKKITVRMRQTQKYYNYYTGSLYIQFSDELISNFFKKKHSIDSTQKIL